MCKECVSCSLRHSYMRAWESDYDMPQIMGISNANHKLDNNDGNWILYASIKVCFQCATSIAVQFGLITSWKHAGKTGVPMNCSPPEALCIPDEICCNHNKNTQSQGPTV